MFVGRNEELNIIKSKLLSPNEHVIIYGNRRVGKTTLANNAAKESGVKFVSFECLKTLLKDNIDALVNVLYEEGIISSALSFDSLISLFQYLNSLKTHLVVIIDEYPYLYVKNDKSEIDSLFQTIIDKYCSNLNIILSGSHIGMMKTLIKKNNPLFGRFNTVIALKELDYLSASEFYPYLSNYDKVGFYAIFGGSPFVLRQLNYKNSLEQNIKDTYLNLTSSINLFISDNYTSDVSTKNMANRIFEVLSNSKERYNRLEDIMGYEHNGLLSKQLDTLLEMEFIDRNEPINKLGDKKKATYYIKNNALRFYFTFIYGKNNILSLLGPDAFYDRYIKNRINTFISLRFEEISRQFISLMVKRGLLSDVLNIGTYYYDDPINKKNGEFDVAIQTSKGYDIIEVKYLKDKVNIATINKELAQIKAIKEIDVKDYGFISINGYEETIPNLKYLYEGNDLYFK